MNRQNKEWKKCIQSCNVEGVLAQCNLIDNQFQQKLEALYSFMPNKSYAYLLNIEASNLVFLRTYNTEFDEYDHNICG